MSRRCTWFAVIGLMLAGCQSAEESAVVDVAPAVEATAVAKAPVSAPRPATPIALPSAPVAEFHPPFPNRTELFVPPRGGQSTVRRDDEHGETVELKGFLDVNGPQVVVAIDGVLAPIPVGGEKYGVQVISINPPQAVLQRGRSRWTASLE